MHMCEQEREEERSNMQENEGGGGASMLTMEVFCREREWRASPCDGIFS